MRTDLTVSRVVHCQATFAQGRNHVFCQPPLVFNQEYAHRKEVPEHIVSKPA
jgi:hypothetical protein